MLEFAIQTPPEHTSFTALRDVWQAADELGFHAAFTFDHLVPLNDAPDGTLSPPRGPQLEGWTTLALMAAGTQRLQVGTLVTGITYRNPALLAKMAVTLDVATDGRAILGIGSGWHQAEHEMFGFDFPAAGQRMGRLEEALEIFTRLWTDDVVDYDGRHYQLRKAVFEPKPVRPHGIPILVGGSGQRLRSIAARHANIFNSFFAPWEWDQINRDLDERARAAGRDPAHIQRSAFVFAELSGDTGREQALLSHFQRTRGGSEQEARARVLVGDPDHMKEVLRSYEQAGVSLVIMNLRAPYDSEDLARFAKEVMSDLTS